MEKDGASLKEDIAEMVYGMDIDRQRHAAEQITFLPEGSHDFVKRAPRQLKGMDLAEMKLMKSGTVGAQIMAEEALKANPNDPRANYLAGRVELVEGDPGSALTHLKQDSYPRQGSPNPCLGAHLPRSAIRRRASIPSILTRSTPSAPRRSRNTKPHLRFATPSPILKRPPKRALKNPFSSLVGPKHPTATNR